MNKKCTLLTYILLHLMLMVYSMSGICSKMASRQAFLSLGFILYYGLVIVLLGFYAIAWQQIIKRMPLTTAYANRAVTVIWGAVWGFLIFHEDISVKKVIGILLVVAGVALYALSDNGEEKSKTNTEVGEKEDVR